VSAGVERHYGGAADLATIDEFHIRGRHATLELARRMELGRESNLGEKRIRTVAYVCRSSERR